MSNFESIPTYFFLRFVYYFQYFIDIRVYLNLVIWMLNEWVKEFWDMSLPRRFFLVFLFDKFSLTSTIFINIDVYDI